VAAFERQLDQLCALTRDSLTAKQTEELAAAIANRRSVRVTPPVDETVARCRDRLIRCLVAADEMLPAADVETLEHYLQQSLHRDTPEDV